MDTGNHKESNAIIVHTVEATYSSLLGSHRLHRKCNIYRPRDVFWKAQRRVGPEWHVICCNSQSHYEASI